MRDNNNGSSNLWLLSVASLQLLMPLYQFEGLGFVSLLLLTSVAESLCDFVRVLLLLYCKVVLI